MGMAMKIRKLLSGSVLLVFTSLAFLLTSCGSGSSGSPAVNTLYGSCSEWANATDIISAPSDSAVNIGPGSTGGFVVYTYKYVITDAEGPRSDVCIKFSTGGVGASSLFFLDQGHSIPAPDPMILKADQYGTIYLYWGINLPASPPSTSTSDATGSNWVDADSGGVSKLTTVAWTVAKDEAGVPGFAITTSSLPNGTVNAAYSPVTLAAANGTTPYTWSSGALPPGLGLNPLTGVLSGTPTVQVTSTNVIISVTDSSVPNQTASRAFTITIAAALTITTTSLPDGQYNPPGPTFYSETLASSGGNAPITWAITANNLPPGLSLNAGTGAITGTPTTNGTYVFTVTATDAVGATATQALQIVIN